MGKLNSLFFDRKEHVAVPVDALPVEQVRRIHHNGTRFAVLEPLSTPFRWKQAV